MHGSATTTSSIRGSRPESVGSEPQILAALKLPGIEAMPSDGRSSRSGKPTCKQEVHFPGPRVEVPIRHSPSAVLQASNREVSGTKQHDGAAIAAGLCSRLHASAPGIGMGGGRPTVFRKVLCPLCDNVGSQHLPTDNVSLINLPIGSITDHIAIVDAKVLGWHLPCGEKKSLLMN